jgi:YHS domain-containing protein
MRTHVLYGAAIAAALSALAQEPAGARLKLVQPAEEMSQMQLPRATAGAAAAKPEISGVRPAILQLKPSSDPIYLEEAPAEEGADRDKWRTYQRPKVDAISRDGMGAALQGYDVLSYLEDGAAVPGREQFTAEYSGVTWRFATAEHRDRFRANPQAYQPEYGGFCAYSVGRGYPATADPMSFKVQDGKLYLFFNRAAQLVWEQDQRRLSAAADRNWPRMHR